MNLYNKIYESLSKIVYHYTQNPESIYRTDKLHSSIYYDGLTKERRVKDEIYYISTARSINSAYISRGVTFELDGEKLSSNYKAEAFDYYSSVPNYKRTEFEDRIILNEPVIFNFHKYIKKIYIILGDYDVEWSKKWVVNLVNLTEDYCKKFGLEYEVLKAMKKGVSPYKKMEFPEGYFDEELESQEIAELNKYTLMQAEQELDFSYTGLTDLMTIIHILSEEWVNKSVSGIKRDNYNRLRYYELDKEIIFSKRRSNYRPFVYWIFDLLKERGIKPDIFSLTNELKEITMQTMSEEDYTKPITNLRAIRDEEMDFQMLVSRIDIPHYIKDWIKEKEKTIEKYR